MNTRSAANVGRSGRSFRLQFTLAGLIAATVVLAAFLGFARVHLALGFVVVGGVLGRLVAARPSGWISGLVHGCCCGAWFAALAALVAALIGMRPEDIRYVLWAGWLAGIVAGGIIGGMIDRGV